MREWDRERETRSWPEEMNGQSCVYGGVGCREEGRVEGEVKVEVEKRAHIFSVIYHHTISLRMYMYGSLLSMY